MPKRKGEKRPVISFNSTSITEGDSLITTLTNLKPRKKFFYALTGDGVDKSDLDSGKVKGRLKASKQGTAVISHLFSEDNFNEGRETFTLSIFKDKKNRKLLGESQAITLKESTREDIGRDSKNNFYAMSGGAKISTNRIYDQDSNLPGKQLLADNFELEYELSKDAIVGTLVSRYEEDKEISFKRIALLGDFEYDQNGELQRGEVREVGAWDYGTTLDNQYLWEYGSVDFNYNGPVSISPNPLMWFSTAKSMQDRQCDYDTYHGEGVYNGERSCMQSYPSSIYFKDEWWENPFTPDLV